MERGEYEKGWMEDESDGKKGPGEKEERDEENDGKERRKIDGSGIDRKRTG